MKRTGCIPLILLLAHACAGFCGCSGPHGRDVIVIQKTRTYHRAVCPPVNMARTTVVTVEEAQAMELRSCPLCQPDSI
jgi:hypothetical protein